MLHFFLVDVYKNGSRKAMKRDIDKSSWNVIIAAHDAISN